MNLGSRVLRGMADSRRRSSGPTAPRWSPSPSTVRMFVTAVVIFALLAFVYLTSTFWVQWWWFDSVGYQTALTTRYVSSAMAFVIAGLIGGGFFGLNWWVALRRTAGLGRGSRIAASPVLRVPLIGLSLATCIFVGLIAAQRWDTWRLALAGNSFGVSDAIFGLDARFYVFLLPALELAHRIALGVTLVTLVAVALLYLGQRGLDRLDQLQATPQARRHLLTLAALALVLFGVGYLLGNYDLQYSTRGFAYGPGFTDVTVTRPLNYVLAIASFAAAAVLLFSHRADRLRWLTFVFLAWAIAVGLGAIIPQVVQQTVVKPNELQREGPYIANNIALTRVGFGLDGADVRNLTGVGEPPASALQADSPVLRNVRLWDYRIARETYQQLQSFVPYYVFNDVDVDRYPEEDQIQQVLVSARELELSGLPQNAQTWINQHLTYTHGYAAVVSPINEATSQGLPVFSVSGIPPNAAGAQTIQEPGLYFGELDENWVAINTGVQEVNGIPGDNPPTRYSGLAKGSIGLDNYFAA